MDFKFVKAQLIITLALVMVITSNYSHALPFGVSDWKYSGDNKTTVDKTTKLEWLDITETLNVSYNEVVANLSVGGSYEGFRLATASELTNFYKNAGIYDPIDKINNFLNLLNYVGASYNSGPLKMLIGYIGDIEYNHWAYKYPVVRRHGFTYKSINSNLIETVNKYNAPESPGTIFGTWLVKSDEGSPERLEIPSLPATPIPEPSTFILLSIGIIGITSYQSKRKKRSQKRINRTKNTSALN